VSLPIYPAMTDKQVCHVVDKVTEAIKASAMATR
jgi:dTDP-4-amino-4,6-dideoxygalactose transaminase